MVEMANNELKTLLIKGNNPYLTIAEVSQRLQLPKHTLRFWEKELKGILNPLRTPGRQRRYRQEDLCLIATIKKLKEEGLSLANIKNEWHTLGKLANSNFIKISLLAKHIAEIIESEINKFLKESQ